MKQPTSILIAPSAYLMASVPADGHILRICFYPMPDLRAPVGIPGCSVDQEFGGSPE